MKTRTETCLCKDFEGKDNAYAGPVGGYWLWFQCICGQHWSNKGVFGGWQRVTKDEYDERVAAFNKGGGF